VRYSGTPGCRSSKNEKTTRQLQQQRRAAEELMAKQATAFSAGWGQNMMANTTPGRSQDHGKNSHDDGIIALQMALAVGTSDVHSIWPVANACATKPKRRKAGGSPWRKAPGHIMMGVEFGR
jgi:hypothetical protein